MSKIKELPWGTDTELKEDQFYNRELEIDNIMSLLSSTSRTSPPTIMIPGIRGVGKTVLLKKLKKELEKDYLVAYIDLTYTYSYQSGKLDEVAIMQHFFQTWMKSCEEKNFNTLIKRIKKTLQTKTIKITDVAEYGGFPIPIAETKEDYQKLLTYVLELPQKIYEEHKKDIKGVIMIIDEFQAFEDLGDHLDGFLWFFRSIIQNQKNVAYIFSGSITSKDKILERISGKKGAFGGRMLTIEISPFDKETTKNYLNERLPSLKFEEEGFEQFYKCSQGIPHYINIFANLLEKDTPLNEEKVKSGFKTALPLLSDQLKIEWTRLNLSQQRIITNLLDKPLKRKKIAEKMNRTSNSLSEPLNSLQDINLIKNSNGEYSLTEYILKEWLKQEYEKKGVYPYRSIK